MPDDLERRHVVIAGGSGFLGTSLASHLTTQGWRVTVLSRHAPRRPDAGAFVAWDGRTSGRWVRHLEDCWGIVNLVGRSVDCVKTPDHQDEILRSRVEATRVLGDAVRLLTNPPRVWVQMSAAHIYGDPPDVVCTEDSPPGYGFAPFIGRAWEAEFERSAPAGLRRVILRTGFVIGRSRGADGGVLARLHSLVRFGLGGTVGSGRQGMSWLHETDMNRLVESALISETMNGVYNASAPHPVSQREFMTTLRRVAGVPIGLPAPA